jgi:hypothetical protein
MNNNVVYLPKYIWGEYIWGYLHSISLIDDEFDNLKLVNDKSHNVINIIKNLHLILPCENCSKHFLSWYESLDKEYIYKPLELFYKTVDLHNDVNKYLQKKEFSYDEALELWGKKEL